MSSAIEHYLDSRLDDYLRDLETLTGIDSGSFEKSGVDRVQDWIERRLRRAGFDVERVPQVRFGDDLIARRTGTGTRRVLLIGHADTVYPTGTAAARPLRTLNDSVFGPGTCDMKAGILAGIYAIESLDAIGWNELEELTFLIVSDEEIGDRHSIDLLEREGARHDALLTLEAARENGDVVTSRKACCLYTVEVRGKAAHAGVEPEKGSSATLALARIVDETYKLNGWRPGATVNPGELSGGTVPNVVADYATGHFDLRAWTNQDLVDLRQTFEQIACRDWVPGTTATATMDRNSLCPAMERTDGVARLETRAMEIARNLGFSLNGAATGGGSDISFAGSSGTPGLDGLGPIGGLDHSPDEYIVRSSIVPRTALLAKLIQAVGAGEEFSNDRRTN